MTLDTSGDGTLKDDPEADTPFELARLFPHIMIYACPSCGRSGDEIELKEDDTGKFVVPVDQRFVQCQCGALIDIGWDGWHWHDPDRAKR